MKDIDNDFVEIGYRIDNFINEIRLFFGPDQLNEATLNGKLRYNRANQELVFVNQVLNGVKRKIDNNEKPDYEMVKEFIEDINEDSTPKILRIQKRVLNNNKYDNEDKEMLVKLTHTYFETVSKINVLLDIMGNKWKEFKTFSLNEKE